MSNPQPQKLILHSQWPCEKEYFLMDHTRKNLNLRNNGEWSKESAMLFRPEKPNIKRFQTPEKSVGSSHGDIL